MRWAVACAVLVAVTARLVHGPGVLGYDAVWALLWGDELIHGRPPSFDAPFAPTPHPLANLVSAPLMLLGADAAGTAVLALSWLSLGVLAVALAGLGAALFSWPVGIAAALVVCTRVQYVAETGQAIVDLPFLALAVTAAVIEVRRPKRGWTVPVLLLLAGLLRPEGWALEAAYLLYRPDVRLALVLATAPVLWAAMDLWATGDPLHSLHGTQALGEALGRPTGSRTALTAAPDALREIVQIPMLWVALAGAAGGLLVRERASRLPAAVVGLGLAGFALLGAAGLPVLDRYLLLPATMLALFAGLALAGLGRAATAVALVVVAAGVPGDLRDLRGIDRFTAERRAVQADLRRAARSADCAAVVTPDARSAAVARLYRERGPRGTLHLTMTRPADYAIGEGRDARPPLGAEERHAGPWWRADAVGC